MDIEIKISIKRIEPWNLYVLALFLNGSLVAIHASKIEGELLREKRKLRRKLKRRGMKLS